MRKVILLLACLTSGAFAQDAGKIAGRVVDAKTHVGIPGAGVVLKGTTWGTSTNENGEYFILNVPPGTYELSASIIGYVPVTKQAVLVDINRTTTVNFSLEETVLQVTREVVITAERPDVVPEKTSTSEIIRTEDALKIPGIQSLSGLLTLSTDVVDGHFRGGREGEELYTLAGMGIVNPLTNALAFAPILSAVEEVEVITSGFSAQYGNAQSGVVNISMKEGKADRWRARAEFRGRMPRYKHFGPSIFDESAQPYLQLLNSPDKWGGADSSTPGSKYYSGIAYGFDSRYKDSVQASQIAYALWKQARRDLNRRYDNLIDYVADFNINGPLSPRVRLFLAGRVEQEWDIVPTPEPERTRRVMGNVIYTLDQGMTIRLTGAYTHEYGNLLRGLGGFSYTGFYNWLWDRFIGISRSSDENGQLGVRFSHVLSPSTYYDIKINMLSTRYEDGAPVTDPNRYVSDDQNNAIWRYFNTPDQFRIASMDNDFRTQRTRTLSFDASLTSQITTSHLVLAGAQLNFFNIDVKNRLSLSDAGTAVNQIYAAKPFELGLFVQDKMEFEGMIANIGLRLDLYNQNLDYFLDQYSPFRLYTSDTTVVYDQNLAAKAKTRTIGRLQPRAGISFPVSANTVFHMNYGSFVQRPSFERTVFSQIRQTDISGMQLGNPRLKPQETRTYDVGVAQALGQGFALDLSGYYKDVKNLIELANFIDRNGKKYSTFVNRDYADIRGFHVSLTKRKGIWTGSVKYSYSVATGKSSTPFNAQPTYSESPAAGYPAAILPNPKDIILDFDRTHNLIVILNLETDKAWGPTVLGISPLANIVVSVKSFARSGRPYTYDTQGLGLINNKRAPAEYNTDLKISKDLPRFFAAGASIYVEVLNVFNQKIYSYNTVFQSASTTTSQSSSLNRNAEKFETNRSALKYYDDFAPFLVDQTFALYSNMTRSVYLGLVLNF